eukprot:3961268-Alexandrium_andersonii.AAC.1
MEGAVVDLRADIDAVPEKSVEPKQATCICLPRQRERGHEVKLIPMPAQSDIIVWRCSSCLKSLR